MKFMLMISLVIALILLGVAAALHLDGQWGHLPTVVALAAVTYGLIGVGFVLGLRKRKKDVNGSNNPHR